MAAKKIVPVVLINFTHTVLDTLKYEILPLNIDCCTDDFFSYVEYPTCTCTSADVYRICGISYMFMYRAAVHSLDAEFTVLEMTTSNAFFSRAQDSVPFQTCFCLANVSDEINFLRAGGELCLRRQFRTRSDRQHELCNYLQFWWFSGLCFEILI